MNPIIKHAWTSEELARWGIRGIEAFTEEELAVLQQKVAGWIRQRVPHTGSNRRRQPFVMKPRTPDPA
ncbi:MAG: hypothetical protein ACREOH_11985 [Candidatus Entotheonellia bacterium]